MTTTLSLGLLCYSCIWMVHYSYDSIKDGSDAMIVVRLYIKNEKHPSNSSSKTTGRNLNLISSYELIEDFEDV